MHDRNGKPLAVGDRVMIPGVITETFPGSTHCNVTVKLDEKIDSAATYDSSCTGNAGQVEKVDP